MNNDGLLINQFFQIQKNAAGIKSKDHNHLFDNCDWDTLIDLSWRNKCSMLFNNEVNKNLPLYQIPSEKLEKWNIFSKSEFLKSYNQFKEFKRVITFLQKNDINPIILKGYVLANLYPVFFERYSSDLDIKLEKNSQETLRHIFIDKLGFTWNEADSKENVDLYYNQNLLIEAHFTLWEDYEGENIAILRNEKLDDPDTLTNVDISEGITICTLGMTEHLILQMFHIVKHYILEGIESRYFCDIAFFINKYKDEIDFKRFWRVFSSMHFEEFCQIYFSECIEHFGMDKTALDGRELRFPEDEAAFLHDIIYLGKRDLNDNASFSLLGILSPYVNGGKKTAESKNGRILQALFPSVNDIDVKYSYCKKYHFLLPIAWVHRAIRTVYFKLTKGDKVYGAGAKLKESEYRIQMMQNVGIK